MMDLFGGPKVITFGDPSINTSAIKGGWQIDLQQGQLLWFPGWVEKKVADKALNHWLTLENNQIATSADLLAINKENEAHKFKNIQWQQDKIKVFGKVHDQPRLSAWFGADAYEYSGLVLGASPLPESIAYFSEKINAKCQSAFNSCLANLYRNGHDYVAAHSDDEKELGINPKVASLSFGVTRRFVLKNKQNQKVEFSLGHGDLLIMQEDLQHHWQHTVPKELSIKELRVNLTFRKILKA